MIKLFFFRLKMAKLCYVLLINSTTGDIIYINERYTYICLPNGGRHVLIKDKIEKSAAFSMYDTIKNITAPFVTIEGFFASDKIEWSENNEYLAFSKLQSYGIYVQHSIWKFDHSISDYFADKLTIDQYVLLKNIAHGLSLNKEYVLSAYEQKQLNTIFKDDEKVGTLICQKLKAAQVQWKK